MNKPIRALLLAAGLGTRLRPLTLSTPKCLVAINGTPLLGHWLHKLESIGCKEVIVNTHYLSSQVEAYLKTRERSTMFVKTIYEKNLLGTAGTLLANLEFFKESTGLLIHADNVMQSDLDNFLKSHNSRTSDCLMTMLTFNTNTPQSCGIVEVDKCGRLTRFFEKVRNPPGNKANGALYAFEESFLHYLSNMSIPPKDFSNDVIPTLLGRIQTWHTSEAFIDIGTKDALENARKIWGASERLI